LALATSGNPVAAMLKSALDKGVTSENVAVMERLMAMYERAEEKEAEKMFAAAFVKLQAEMPQIFKTKPVPDKNGNLKYKFAPYEDIMDAVRPVLQANGFTISFSMSFKDGRVIQECTLTHVAGHSRKNQFMARVGNGPPGSSEAQGDGAASTYAKRFALCDALNIVIETDNDGKNPDARADGAPITEDQALYLHDLIKQCGSKVDMQRFLDFAGAKTIEEIGASRYEGLAAGLRKKLEAPAS
jgi:hypothetical protein